MTVLFAGGCHFAGYPVGQYDGFVDTSVRLLQRRGLDIHAVTLTYLNLKQSDRVAKAVRESNPDLLVLHPGQFELMRPRARGRRGGFNEDLQSRALRLSPFRGWWGRSSFRVKDLAKSLHHSLGGGFQIDGTQFAARLDAFLAGVRAATPMPVLVMSPLYSADSVTRRIRMDCMGAYRRSAAKYDMTLLDLLGAEWRDLALHFDEAHLNAAGHRLAAERLARAVAAQLESRKIARRAAG